MPETDAVPANRLPGQDMIEALSPDDAAAAAKYGKLDKKRPSPRVAGNPKLGENSGLGELERHRLLIPATSGFRDPGTMRPSLKTCEFNSICYHFCRSTYI